MKSYTRYVLVYLVAPLIALELSSSLLLADNVTLEKNGILRRTLEPGGKDKLLLDSRVDSDSELYVDAPGATMRLYDSDGTLRLSAPWPGRACGRDFFWWIHDKPGTWYLELETECKDAPLEYSVEWRNVRRDGGRERTQLVWALANAGENVSRLLNTGNLDSAREEAESLLARLDENWPPVGTAYLQGFAKRFRTISCSESEGYLERAIRRSRNATPECQVRELGDLLEIQHLAGRVIDQRDTAQAYLDKAIEVHGPSAPDVANARRVLGDALLEAGEYDLASESLEAGLTNIEGGRAVSDGQMTLLRASLLNSLAEVRRAQNQYDEADRLAQHAWQLSQASTSPDSLSATIANTRAGLARDRGNFAEAESWIEIVNRLVQSGCGIGSFELKASADLNRAEILRLQQRYDESRPLYERSISLRQRSSCSDSPRVAWGLNQLGKLEHEVGKTETAIEKYESARLLLEYADIARHPLKAQNLLDLASARNDNGEFQKAEEVFLEAVRVAEVNFSGEHPEVAQSLVGLGRFRFERYQSTPGNMDLLASARAETKRALTLLKLDSLGSRLALAYPQTAVEALILNAQISQASGEAASERESLEKALEIVDKLRFYQGGRRVRTQFVGRELHLQAMEDLVHHYVVHENLPQAVLTLERFRGRLLSEEVESTAGSPLRALSESERTRHDEDSTSARRKVSLLQRRLTEVQWSSLEEPSRSAELERLVTDLEEAVRDYERVRDRAHNAAIRSGIYVEGPIEISLDELRRSVIPEHGAILVYVIGLTRSYAFLVPRTGEILAEALELSDSLSEQLGTGSGPLTISNFEPIFRRLLSERESRGRGVTAVFGTLDLEALAGVVVPPRLWTALQDLDEVLVIPDGPLHYLPFSALVFEGDFWVKTTLPAIRYIPSAAFLYRRNLIPHLPQETSNAKSVLSVTYPIYDPKVGEFLTETAAVQAPIEPDSKDWASTMRRLAALEPYERLEGTEAETHAIQKAFGAQRVEVLSELQATEQALREKIDRHPYLHIATHGRVAVGSAELLAGLALTHPLANEERDDNDGFLNAYEVMELDLARCELAVLSACKTNIGPIMPGEGVFGLSAAFLTAGTRRVVSTLWQVDDASTALLIGFFFEELARSEGQQDLSYASALRNAQRKLASNPRYADPYYWAPFVISGER